MLRGEEAQAVGEQRSELKSREPKNRQAGCKRPRTGQRGVPQCRTRGQIRTHRTGRKQGHIPLGGSRRQTRKKTGGGAGADPGVLNQRATSLLRDMAPSNRVQENGLGWEGSSNRRQPGRRPGSRESTRPDSVRGNGLDWAGSSSRQQGRGPGHREPGRSRGRTHERTGTDSGCSSQQGRTRSDREQGSGQD